MSRVSADEVFLAPELALLPVLLAALQAADLLLHARHPTIDLEPTQYDPNALRAARAALVEIDRTRRALIRYARAARRAPRAALAADDSPPF